MEPETVARSRRFTLRDALILVAATAAGLATTRGLAAVHAIHSMDSVNFWTTHSSASGRSVVNAAYFPDAGHGVYALAMYWAQRISLWSSPCLLLWTSALFVMALTRPGDRPFTRPGPLACVACVAALVALGAVSPQSLVGRSTIGTERVIYWGHWLVTTCFGLPKASALAVSICWLTLALSGNWRPDRGWLDRLGRVLGACWILVGLTSVASSWLSLLIG